MVETTHPIKTKGSLSNDSDYQFDRQVRREISRDEYDEMRRVVNREVQKGNIGYSVLFPRQCSTEAINLSAAAGWVIDAPKEKVSPFLPAQPTPNSLYDFFDKPQAIDLTNMDEHGKPRLIEVFDLGPDSNNNRNHDPFEE